MKRSLIVLPLILLCVIFSGCKKLQDESFKIVTSCYPVYVMSLNIAKNVPNAKVVNMCEINTGCLHNFQLKSDDLKKIEESSAFVINGAGMESFLDKIVDELPKVKVVDSSKNIELLKDNCDCDEEHGHHEHYEHNEYHENSEHVHTHAHCHHEYNPHIWMSVSNCIKQVENIKNELILIDPIHENMYEENAKNYIYKLEELKNKIHSKLDSLKNKDIITFHDAFPYFANEFGLNIVGVINHEPEEEPNMKELKSLIDLIKDKNVKNLFVEPQYPQGIATTIANETNAKVYVLDPAVTGEDSADSYINIMEKNLNVLCEALG